jgi:hypothetical protein
MGAYLLSLPVTDLKPSSQTDNYSSHIRAFYPTFLIISAKPPYLCSRFLRPYDATFSCFGIIDVNICKI